MDIVIERPDLSDEEVDALCPNLTQNAAKVRYLREVLGLQVDRRSNGRPLVWRHALRQAKGMPTKPPRSGTSRRGGARRQRRI